MRRIIALEGTIAPTRVVDGCGVNLKVVYGSWTSALWAEVPSLYLQPAANEAEQSAA